MRYLRTKSSVGLVMMLVLLASVALLWADPGDLDLTFGGGDGYVITDFDQSDWIEEMVIDSNNRIVAVGGSSDLNDYQSAIIRYNPDGTLDETFGDQGLVWLASPIATNNIALDNSGRIVVIGHDGGLQGVLARFNADGTADLTFGNQGIVIDPNWYEFYALRITSDNKITVIGDRDNSDEALTRYQVNGDLDASFGDVGVAVIPHEYVQTSRSLLATEDGGTLVVGNTLEVVGSNPQTPDIFLAKYTIDGDLDLNFGNQGSITTSIGLHDYVTQAVIDSENRIVVVGSTLQFTTGIVLRYLPDGNIDTTFGVDGVILTEIPDMEFFSNEAVIVDETDRLVVMGVFGTNLHSYDYFPYIARYSLDGTLDTTFGGGTGITQPFLAEPHVIFDGALDNQGNIVVTGAILGELHFKDILLARYQGGDLPATATPTPTDTITATETPEATATMTPSNTPTQTATATDATTEPTATSTPDGSIDWLMDGGFEVESTGWQVKNLSLDKVKCDKPGKPVAYEGNCAFRFKGSVGENSQVFQKPNLGGYTFATGDNFTLQAYIYARGQVDFQGQAKFTYADDTKEKIALNVGAATDGYTVFADDYALTDANLAKVKVTLKNKSISGKIDVDAVSLGYVEVESSLLPLP